MHELSAHSMLDLTDEAVHGSTYCLTSFEACRSTATSIVVPQPKRFTKCTKAHSRKGEMEQDLAVIASVRKEIGAQIWKQECTRWTETDSDKERWIATFERMCSLQTGIP